MNVKLKLFQIPFFLSIAFLFSVWSINTIEAQEYLTEKALFAEDSLSILEEKISIKIDADYNTIKTSEYLIKNISDTENIPFYFATDRNSDEIQLKLDDISCNLMQVQGKMPEHFYTSNIIEVIDPFTKESVSKDPYRVSVNSYSKVYQSNLNIKKGEFAKIILEYPSKNIAPEFINIINPIKTQTHQFISSKSLVDGAVIYLELELPENFEYVSNVKLFKRPDGKYSAVTDKKMAAGWNITFASSDGLFFMTNFVNIHNENVLKALASTIILSLIMFLVKHRELTKNKQSEFAQLKSHIFGGLSLVFFLMSVAVFYFIKLPANLAAYWNYIYAFFIVLVSIASYIFYKNRDKIKLDFSEKEEA